jgi:hypothetical protein
MLNFTGHQGNANQIHKEIASHPGRIAIIKKRQEITNVGENTEQ